MKHPHLKASHRKRLRKQWCSSLAGAPSKKEFEAFAKILCRHDAPLPLVRDFADYFAQTNPRFQRVRFVEVVASCKRR